MIKYSTVSDKGGRCDVKKSMISVENVIINIKDLVEYVTVNVDRY